MNSVCKVGFVSAASLALVTFVGLKLGETPAMPRAAVTSSTQVIAPLVNSTPAPSKAIDTEATTPLMESLSLDELRAAWMHGKTLADLDPIAQELAQRNSAESVQVLMDGIGKTRDWATRAALAKNLRSVSDPETLQVLLPALLNNYGRGNTILNEISDTIGRIAQPETIEELAALHWQASTQAGQGHKVLRTVACIRNPAAKRGLVRLAARSESPALAAAAQEALKAM